MSVLLTRQQIIEGLTGLGADDRAEIIRWCEALGARPMSRGETADTEHAFELLSRSFSLHYQVPQLSLIQFARTRPNEYRKLVRAVDHAIKLVKHWWPGQRRNTHLALLCYLCSIAFAMADRRSSRVTWAKVISLIADIEATVNDAFPGWLRAGEFHRRALQRVLGRGEGDVWTEPDSGAKLRRQQRIGNRERLLHDSR